MSVEFTFDSSTGANAFWHPFWNMPCIILPILWENSVAELSGNPEIKLDDFAFFCFRLNETILHEFLHGLLGLEDEKQLYRVQQELREALLYDS